MSHGAETNELRSPGSPSRNGQGTSAHSPNYLPQGWADYQHPPPNSSQPGAYYSSSSPSMQQFSNTSGSHGNFAFHGQYPQNPNQSMSHPSAPSQMAPSSYPYHPMFPPQPHQPPTFADLPRPSGRSSCNQLPSQQPGTVTLGPTTTTTGSTSSEKTKGAVKAKQQNLQQKLLECVSNNGTFDVIGAGQAILEAYRQGDESEGNAVGASMEQFAKKNANNIRSFRFANSSDFKRPDFYLHDHFGNTIFTLITNYRRSNANQEDQASINALMDSLVGSMDNLVGRQFTYPEIYPFSGKPIPVDAIFYQMNKPVHVQLRHFILRTICRSSEDPSKLKETNWTLQRSVASEKRTSFSYAFYAIIRDLMTCYFGVAHEELDEEWQPGHINLPFLGTVPEPMRLKKFRKLASCKQKFVSKVFHGAFLLAIKELNSGTFAPTVRSGEDVPRFILRSRIAQSKQKALTSENSGRKKKPMKKTERLNEPFDDSNGDDDE